MNTLMQVVPVAKAAEIIEVPQGTSLAECRKLHASGKQTRWAKKG